MNACSARHALETCCILQKVANADFFLKKFKIYWHFIFKYIFISIVKENVDKKAVCYLKAEVYHATLEAMLKRKF